MSNVSRISMRDLRDRLDELARPLDEQQVTALGEELLSLADIMRRQPALRRALTTPSVSAEDRVGFARSLVGSRMSAPGGEMLEVLVRRRFRNAIDLVGACEELYAWAFLILAERDGAVPRVEDELFRFGRTVERTPDLERALSDPSMPAESRDALVTGLLRDKVHPVTIRLLRLAVDYPLGKPFTAALDDLVDLTGLRHSATLARVTVASAIDEAEQQRLESALERLYGRDLDLQIDLDPSIIGGVVVRVGDEVIDGSVARRLRQSRDLLIS